MAEAPEGFDLDALLAPVTGETEAGADLREDFSPQALYYGLRDARAEARAIERRMDGGDDPEGTPITPPVQQWATVRRLARSALAESTKDLEIAAWLTEALVRSDALPGFIFGCRLMAGLVERYWEALFPLPDEEGIPTRVAPVTGLNGEGVDGTLIQPLRKVVLFERASGEPVALYHYEQSLALSGISDEEKRRARIDAGTIPFETLEAEARVVPPETRAALLADAREAESAWMALRTAMETHAGADAPPTGRVQEVLEKITEAARRFGPDGGGADAADPFAAAPDTIPAGEAGRVGGGMGTTAAAARGPVASREDALRQLDEIAAFFRRTEPNSPLAYTLAEAARRGRMSWPDLLLEVVPDADARRGILVGLGIRPPADPE